METCSSAMLLPIWSMRKNTIDYSWPIAFAWILFWTSASKSRCNELREDWIREIPHHLMNEQSKHSVSTRPYPHAPRNDQLRTEHTVLPSTKYPQREMMRRQLCSRAAIFRCDAAWNGPFVIDCSVDTPCREKKWWRWGVVYRLRL